MRVPVLITITFASGTTALLASVMRPVSEAFVDCGQSGVTEDKRIPARTRIARRATCQDHLATLKGKTKFKILVSFPARLDRVPTYPAVIHISGLSRRQRKEDRARYEHQTRRTGTLWRRLKLIDNRSSSECNLTNSPESAPITRMKAAVIGIALNVSPV